MIDEEQPGAADVSPLFARMFGRRDGDGLAGIGI